MLENSDTRYEFYMQGIKKSNFDDTIVRWELRYDLIHKMSLGSSHKSGNRIVCDTFETFVEKLVLKGFKPVTYDTMKFA